MQAATYFPPCGYSWLVLLFWDHFIVATSDICVSRFNVEKHIMGDGIVLIFIP